LAEAAKTLEMERVHTVISSFHNILARLLFSIFFHVVALFNTPEDVARLVLSET